MFPSLEWLRTLHVFMKGVYEIHTRKNKSKFIVVGNDFNSSDY